MSWSTAHNYLPDAPTRTAGGAPKFELLVAEGYENLRAFVERNVVLFHEDFSLGAGAGAGGIVIEKAAGEVGAVGGRVLASTL